MKIKYLLTLTALIISVNSCSITKKITYNDLPVIKSIDKNVDYKIGSDWVYGQWSVVPEIENDTLQVVCYAAKERFRFRTDVDSIEFDIAPGQTKRFYVLVGEDSYAHTIIEGIIFQSNNIVYNQERADQRLATQFQTGSCEYLEDLKQQYPLDAIVSQNSSDKEKVLAVLNWTSSRWMHSGNNAPKKNDAISILDEAKAGGRFPCFAYAIVLRDQLAALGFKARTVYLKTQDAATRTYSPGHVATEVFLEDMNKWVFVDGQFNVMPSLNGLPLNAVEFQNAISNHLGAFKLESNSMKPIVSKRNYVNFVYDYLFYLDTSLDNRYDSETPYLVDGRRSMMLVPEGAKDLVHINFWDMDVDYCLYTRSAGDFYAPPE